MEDVRAGAANSLPGWKILGAGWDGMRERLTYEELVAPVRERLMRVLEERSYREIAEALGCRETTARTHVLRGRAKLSRWLSHLRPSGQVGSYRTTECTVRLDMQGETSHVSSLEHTYLGP